MHADHSTSISCGRWSYGPFLLLTAIWRQKNDHETVDFVQNKQYCRSTAKFGSKPECLKGRNIQAPQASTRCQVGYWGPYTGSMFWGGYQYQCSPLHISGKTVKTESSPSCNCNTAENEFSLGPKIRRACNNAKRCNRLHVNAYHREHVYVLSAVRPYLRSPLCGELGRLMF